jgi:hypothetical protein
MPYSLNVRDAAQPADGDAAFVAAAELREIKRYLTRVPQRDSAVNETFAITDAGAAIRHTPGDASTRTWRVPTNAAVPFEVGTTITLVVPSNSGTITLDIDGTDTLQLAGSGSTGARNLSPGALVTLYKHEATKWFVTGAGVA